MKPADHAPLIAIAMLAARADGSANPAEQQAIDAVVTRIGSPDVSRLAEQVAAGQLRVGDLAALLSDAEARRAAYEAALAVCNADGAANAAERGFLEQLRSALGLSSAEVAEAVHTAGALAQTPVAEVHTGKPPAGPLDELILRQAMLAGALEILPSQLATIAVLPLQLRLVFQVGQRHGQKLDADQVRDLVATLGLGAATQGVGSIVTKIAGGLAGGLLGGLIGGAARFATGAVLTFGATYALGHVADEYYRQGRVLGANDLRALFDQFQRDARTLYPQVEQQIRAQARSLNVGGLIGALRSG